MLTCARVFGECAIDFHAGQALHASAQKIRSHTRAGANFEDILAYVGAVKHPWKDVGLDRFSPICGAAEPTMSELHFGDSCLFKTA
jgi:hypothetical protein